MYKIIFSIAALFAASSSVFCMQSPGMQELAKHKIEFQAGIKKLQDFIPESAQKYHENDGLTPTSRALFIAAERDMRNRAQSIAKELETAFNAVSASRTESQPIVVQKPEKPAALKKLWEQLHPGNPEASMAAASFSAQDIAVYGPIASSVAKKNAQLFQDIVKEFEAAFAQRDELIAHLQAQASSQHAVSLQEHQSLANTLAQVRTQLQEKTVALQTKENENAQLQEAQKRVASILALFETSTAIGWEASCIQALKSEWEK